MATATTSSVAGAKLSLCEFHVHLLPNLKKKSYKGSPLSSNWCLSPTYSTRHREGSTTKAVTTQTQEMSTDPQRGKERHTAESVNEPISKADLKGHKSYVVLKKFFLHAFSVCVLVRDMHTCKSLKGKCVHHSKHIKTGDSSLLLEIKLGSWSMWQSPLPHIHLTSPKKKTDVQYITYSSHTASNMLFPETASQEHKTSLALSLKPTAFPCSFLAHIT